MVRERTNAVATPVLEAHEVEDVGARADEEELHERVVVGNVRAREEAVSYTHLTLPTIYSV